MRVSEPYQARERRIGMFRPESYLHLIERLEVLRGGGLYGVMLRLERLDDGGTAVRAAPDASRNLCEHLESALARTKIWDGQPGVCRDDPDQCDLRDIQPLCHHLGSYEHPRIAIHKAVKHLGMRPRSAGHVTVPAQHPRAGESSLHLGYDRLRAAPHRAHVFCVADTAYGAGTDTVSAVVAHEAIDAIREVRSMHGERRVATTARADVPAPPALNVRGRSPTVQEQDHPAAGVQ